MAKADLSVSTNAVVLDIQVTDDNNVLAESYQGLAQAICTYLESLGQSAPSATVTVSMDLVVS